MCMPAIRLQWRRLSLCRPEQASHAVSNRTAWATRALFFIGAFWLLLTTGAVAQAQFVFPRRLPDSVTPRETNNATVAANSQASSAPDLLTLDEAQRLAAPQASAFQRAGISEQIASEDVRQARAAFRPKVTAPGSYIYTSPAIDPPPGTPREQSFINANAISEYLALMN